MMPPLQSTALQQNEAVPIFRQQQQSQINCTQQAQLKQQQQQQQTASTTICDNGTTNEKDQFTSNEAKFQPIDLLVENNISYVSSPPVATQSSTHAHASAALHTKLPATNRSIVYLQQQEDSKRQHYTSSSCTHDDTLNFGTIRGSTTAAPVSVASTSVSTSAAYIHSKHHSFVQPNTQKCYSLLSHFSRSLSTDDCYSLSTSTRACSFDDAAENFIINPANSQHSLHKQNGINSLPLSETVPLLTNIESAEAANDRSIYLSKNSGSLIFTKKELLSNNNSQQQHLQKPGRQSTKHLPSTYQHQQSINLEHNYNNNLVTKSKCGSSANNNHCCSTKSTGIEAYYSASALHKCRQQQKLSHHISLANKSTGTRKQHAYSWYAPVYSALEEELEQDSRDSSPIHNLANTKHQQPSANRYQHCAGFKTTSPAHGDNNDTVALLDQRNKLHIETFALVAPSTHEKAKCESSGVQRTQGTLSVPTTLALHHLTKNGGVGDGVGSAFGKDLGGGTSQINANHDYENGLLTGSLALNAGPLPRKRRFENFLKSLVGLKTKINGNGSGGSIGIGNETNKSVSPIPLQQHQRPVSPEIRITRTPSEQDVILRSPGGKRHSTQSQCSQRSSEKPINGGRMDGSTSSLNVVQQKLWNIIRREGSATSLNQEKSQSIVQYTGLRKCETVLALTRQSNSLLSPVHNERQQLLDANQQILKSSHSGSGIFSASGVEQIRPLNRLRNSVYSINGTTGGAPGTCSRCSSILSLAASGSRYSLNVSTHGNVCSGNFINAITPSPSHHELSGSHPQPSQFTTHLRHQPTHSLSFSSDVNMLHKDIVENTNYDAGAYADDEAKGSVRLCDSSCGLRGSVGAQITTHSASGISHPSNVTTTLNSTNAALPQITNSTINITNNNIESSGSYTIRTTPNAAILEELGTTHAYPLTVTSLMTMSGVTGAAQNCDIRDGVAIVSNLNNANASQSNLELFTCKLCLIDVDLACEATTLQHCGCKFCTECMRAYVEFEISEGAYEISCPDATCPAQGALTLTEMANLTTANLLKKHHRYRLNREIELDKTRTWCPRAGCETVCLVGSSGNSQEQSDSTPSTSATSHSISFSPTLDGVNRGPTSFGVDNNSGCAVQCPSCKDEFCSICKKTWHPNISCEEHSRRLVADGADDIGIPFDNELIKCCPMCAVPIEKDEGCAQMMCKRCKHVFCWYCLASLDDDFLLRHYDKGPCKNKLGHSRASVVWHRAQVIGIFAGFGILLLVASPLLLLAAPCIICCKCRSCGGSKLDEVEGEIMDDEVTALQS